MLGWGWVLVFVLGLVWVLGSVLVSVMVSVLVSVSMMVTVVVMVVVVAVMVVMVMMVVVLALVGYWCGGLACGCGVRGVWGMRGLRSRGVALGFLITYP